MTDGIGYITWWGFSPSLDFQDENDIGAGLENFSATNSEEAVMNILLVGTGDGRHILKTVAKAYKHQKKKLNFYVIENSLELYARQLLFMIIALEPPNQMGLQKKARTYMEILGNTLVRPSVHEYIQNKASQLLLMVTDPGYLQKRLPLVSLEHLKYKEIDALEGILKTWRTPCSDIFKIQSYWDSRLRHQLDVRYDHRTGVFDWDYHMKLCERGGSIINVYEYKNWRETGVAYQWPETDTSQPNMTLASGIVVKSGGSQILKQGYWGDMVTGPFIPYGIDCYDKTMLKKSNGIYDKTSTNICESNVLSMMYELQHRDKYDPAVLSQGSTSSATENNSQGAMTPSETPFTASASSPTPAEGIQEKTNPTEETDTAEEVCSCGRPAVAAATENKKSNKIQEETYDPVNVDDVKVFFLPLNASADLPRKSKFQRFFNMVFFSNSMVHHMSTTFMPVVANGAIVLVENVKYILDLRPEHMKEYGKKITSMATAAGCELQADFDPMKDLFARFKYTGKNVSSE